MRHLASSAFILLCLLCLGATAEARYRRGGRGDGERGGMEGRKRSLLEVNAEVDSQRLGKREEMEEIPMDMKEEEQEKEGRAEEEEEKEERTEEEEMNDTKMEETQMTDGNMYHVAIEGEMEKEEEMKMEEEEEDRKMPGGPVPPELPVPIMGFREDGAEPMEGAMRENMSYHVPILNVVHDFRYPTVEAFSYAEGEPMIEEGPGIEFDRRPFSMRSETRNFEGISTGCGGTFTALTGIVTSPAYPFNYENNIRCVYKIVLPSEYTVGLDCNDFSIQPGDKGCENDFLAVSDNGGAEEPTNTFCGDKAIAAFSSSSNMTLVFQTDSSYRYRGFMCRYRALNPDGTGAVGTVTTNSTAAEHTVICTGPGDDGWAGKCGVSNSRTRIVGGQATIEHEFPWMVAVLKICGKDMEHYCHICGGTIIHSQWILTGAHCLVSVPVETVAMLLGDHNLYTLTPSQKFFRVEAIYVHPDFNVPSPLNNDIALAKLPQKIAFSQYIAPICIPPKDHIDLLNLLPRKVEEESSTASSRVIGGQGDLLRQGVSTTEVPKSHTIIHRAFDNRNVSVFGWGTIDDDGSLAQMLRWVSVQILPNDFCDYYYGLMTDTMMCTSGAGGHGPCRGDSGSPAQMKMVDGRWLQVGVLAFGAAYGCEVGYPSGNVLLPLYVDWLEFVTGFDFSEYY